MIDLQVKVAILAGVAWLVTRRVTPANAARAHRLWLVVVFSPVLWLIGESWFSPVAYAGLRQRVVPDALVAAAARLQSSFVILYVVVSAALLGRIFGGVLSVRRLLHSSREVDPVDRRRMPGGRRCQIREASLQVPVTAGFLEPVILLPSNWRRLSSRGLEAILHHEAAHVRRKDCAVALVCAVVEALFWFNPFIWLAGRQVRAFAEMACDAEAARAMDGETYASELLHMAASWRTARRPLYAITAGAETNVGRRIRLLLDEMETGRRRGERLHLVAVFLLLGMVLAGTIRVGGMVSSFSQTPLGPWDDHATVHQLRHRH